MIGEGVEPIDYLAVAATFLNQAAQAIATIASNLSQATRNTSVLPMRSLKMIAPSRGMRTMIA